MLKNRSAMGAFIKKKGEGVLTIMSLLGGALLRL